MGSRSLLALLLLLTACARTTLKSSVAETHTGTDATSELDFWDGLAKCPAVSNTDALHALLLSTAQSGATHEERVKAARAREWIGTEALPANETARVGWVARAICLECKIKGGVNMRLFHSPPRYAVRELNYRGWLPNMSEQQTISGLQLIALLGKAEDYRKDITDRPREDL